MTTTGQGKIIIAGDLHKQCSLTQCASVFTATKFYGTFSRHPEPGTLYPHLLQTGGCHFNLQHFLLLPEFALVFLLTPGELNLTCPFVLLRFTEGHFQDLVHVLNRYELHLLPDGLGDFHQILLVLLRDNNLFHT